MTEGFLRSDTDESTDSMQYSEGLYPDHSGPLYFGKASPSLLGLIAVHGLTIDDSVKDHYPDPGGGHGALSVDVPHHDMWCKRDRRPLEH